MNPFDNARGTNLKQFVLPNGKHIWGFFINITSTTMRMANIISKGIKARPFLFFIFPSLCFFSL